MSRLSLPEPPRRAGGPQGRREMKAWALARGAQGSPRGAGRETRCVPGRGAAGLLAGPAHLPGRAAGPAEQPSSSTPTPRLPLGTPDLRLGPLPTAPSSRGSNGNSTVTQITKPPGGGAGRQHGQATEQPPPTREQSCQDASPPRHQRLVWPLPASLCQPANCGPKREGACGDGASLSAPGAGRASRGRGVGGWLPMSF